MQHTPYCGSSRVKGGGSGGCGLPSARGWGLRSHPEGGETELRLTVNFVVARVVRNFEASGLTFRSNGNHRRWKQCETPETVGRDPRERENERVYVCVCVYVSERERESRCSTQPRENARYFLLETRNYGFRATDVRRIAPLSNPSPLA